MNASRFSISFDIATGGMERLRNQDEGLMRLELDPELTGQEILDGAAFDLERDDAAYMMIEAARPEMSGKDIDAALDEMARETLAALKILIEARAPLSQANPFKVEAPESEEEEGCGLFVYIASELFREA